MVLILKLILAPLLVAAATLTTRRWGARIGGLLMGLPLTTGPIFVFWQPSKVRVLPPGLRLEFSWD